MCHTGRYMLNSPSHATLAHIQFVLVLFARIYDAGRCLAWESIKRLRCCSQSIALLANLNVSKGFVYMKVNCLYNFFVRCVQRALLWLSYVRYTFNAFGFFFNKFNVDKTILTWYRVTYALENPTLASNQGVIYLTFFFVWNQSI